VVFILGKFIHVLTNNNGLFWMFQNFRFLWNCGVKKEKRIYFVGRVEEYITAFYTFEGLSGGYVRRCFELGSFLLAELNKAQNHDQRIYSSFALILIKCKIRLFILFFLNEKIKYLNIANFK
jgi:hypothetical protein